MKTKLSIDAKILSAIHSRGKGAVFVPADFLEFGSREAIDIALHRLTNKGTIRRLTRGVYYFPKTHAALGLLSPSAEAVAKALAGRDYTRLQPAGAFAANALGLSEQVPAKIVFLTDGPSRTVKIGPTTIQLRRTTAKNMAAAGRLSDERPCRRADAQRRSRPVRFDRADSDPRAAARSARRWRADDQDPRRRALPLRPLGDQR